MCIMQGYNEVILCALYRVIMKFLELYYVYYTG